MRRFRVGKKPPPPFPGTSDRQVYVILRLRLKDDRYLRGLDGPGRLPIGGVPELPLVAAADQEISLTTQERGCVRVGRETVVQTEQVLAPRIAQAGAVK